VSLRRQVGEIFAKRLSDERIELERNLAGRIRKLAQAQDQCCALVVL
jgi:hypothetical protein